MADKRAFLTIDDGPTPLTDRLTDYLAGRGLPALLFTLGNQWERSFDAGVRAIARGFVVGNHSDSHPGFSRLSLAEAIREVQRTEVWIDRAYRAAGRARPAKYFRYPFGDRGGEAAPDFRRWLSAEGFVPLSSPRITYDWYQGGGLAAGPDLFWTFDVQDYRLAEPGGQFTLDHILDHLRQTAPPQGGSLVVPGSDEIVLMHDQPDVDACVPRYYETYLSAMIDLGVQFQPIA